MTAYNERVFDRKLILLTVVAVFFGAPVAMLAAERVIVSRFAREADRLRKGASLVEIEEQLGSATDQGVLGAGHEYKSYQRTPEFMRNVSELPLVSKLIPNEWLVGHELTVHLSAGKVTQAHHRRDDPTIWYCFRF